MDNFRFYNPTKIIFGKGVINSLGDEILKFEIKKVMLLAGGGSIKSNGVYQQTIKSLQENNIDWVEFWGVQPNPVLIHTLEAIDICRREKVDAVIAVGGGSVIDEAKSIAAGFYSKNVWNLYEKIETIKKALPFFVVLTLSATGSEMNSFCVLTNTEEQKKWAFGSPLLYPKASFIDPQVQMSLPWKQTVNGGVDAMSHIHESYFGGNYEESTLSINEALLKTIIISVDNLQKNENDYNSRANLAWSASLALCGLTGVSMHGGEWVVHKIEHAVSALNPKVAHGEGLAVLFPAWIKYVNKFKPHIFERWAKNVWNVNSVDEAINAMTAKHCSWKAPVTLGELAVTEDMIPALAENAMMQGPVGKIKIIQFEDVVNILKLAL
jgi:hypothetical protein